MPTILLIVMLQVQYTTPLPPVDILAPVALDTDCCETSMTRGPRGRPKKEHFRKKDARVRRGIAMVTLVLWAVCHGVKPAVRQVTIRGPAKDLIHDTRDGILEILGT